MLIQLQNIILRMIAKGETLEATADRLCIEAEKIAPGICCSILTLDDEGLLHPLSAPSMPAAYSAALDRLPIGPEVGSCGTAAFSRKPVTVTDIATDPLWRDFRALALPLGLAACWSSPIINAAGKVVGTFAFYYREKRGPQTIECDIVKTCLPLCLIAFERNDRVREHRRLAFSDMLTGLPNRARFNAELADRPSATSAEWGLLIVDIDNLKTVNDTFGHAAGDDLIKAAAHRIAVAVEPGRAFRLGGDEFAVIMPAANAQTLQTSAERILDAMKSPLRCGEHTIFPSATIGGSLSSALTNSPDAIRQNADYALYHAKEQARGHFVCHSAQLDTAITERFEAIRAVSRALDDNRIEAHYQPIVRLDSHEIVGLEALCRMRSADGSLIAAKDFHEATKDAHVAAELTRRMVSRVAADIRRWLDLGIPMQHVGINVSAADFRVGHLKDFLCQSFREAGVPMKHLILEVTESVYLGQRDDVIANEIHMLRENGLRVALDDFGTGFASLTHLLTVPVDIIKIDKSFVDRITHDDKSLAIIEGLLSIAKRLNLRVVAEGIETAEQAQQLLDAGCLMGQGYHFSRAVPRDTITQMMLHRAQRPEGRQSAKQEKAPKPMIARQL